MAIIFDFNGTMVFDGDLHDQAWKSISKEIRKIPLSDEELQTHIHGNVNEKIIEYLIGNVDPKQSECLSLYKEQLYRTMVEEHKLTLVNGLTKFLNYLKEHQIPITIASASIKENIDFFYDYFHLSRWFCKEDIIYDDTTHKNKVSMFLAAAKKLNTPIDQCIVFEDSLSGIKYAKEAGIKTIVCVGENNIKDTTMCIQDYTNTDIYKLI